MAFNILKKTVLPQTSERTLLSPLELKRTRIKVLYIVNFVPTFLALQWSL
jgi:hypothetical protein